MPCFYLTPKPDDFNQELQICFAEALYDVDSIVADPGVYTRKNLRKLGHAEKWLPSIQILRSFADSQRRLESHT